MASRILLADDSITIQKVVNLTFADEGIEVVAVSNGDQAERRLLEVMPDLVLADIFMPGKNGYELCESIKENPQFRNVPVVLLVGAFEPFDQAEARRVRADAHLTKPFESRTLVETVRRLISASGRTTAGPIAPTPPAAGERNAAPDAPAPVAPVASLAPPLAGKLDLSAMMVDDSVAPLAPGLRNTGELASPLRDERQEVLDAGLANASNLEAGGAALTDTSQRFEPLEFSTNGGFSPAEMARSFDQDTQDMIQDFDTSQPFGQTVSQDPISFETEPSDSVQSNTGAGGGGEEWFNRLDTTMPEKSSNGGAWQPSATGSPLGYQSPDFKLQTEGTLAASEGSTETACATLLAVDEPLGDVLFDEAGLADSLAFSEMAANDSAGLELAEPEVAEAAPGVSTQFDLVDIVADSSEELFVFEENRPATEATLTAEETPAAVEESPDPVSVDSLPDSPPVTPEATNHLDWTTPRAVSYSTAQLDSVAMPIEAAEYLAEHSVREDRQQAENQEEASFATPTMWTEEETRFTPIDIEAVSVEETSAENVGQVETGFAFSSFQDEEPTASSHDSVASGAEDLSTEPPAATLSSAAIEEIVRRVVTEMSESVVREVAWEVVPDCVERVIEQLTRESLSKRA